MTLGPNLLPAEASGFEGGTTGGWSFGSATINNTNATARSGSLSLAIHANDAVNNPYGYAANVAVVAGLTYTVQAWLRAAATPRAMQASMWWYDASSAYLGQGPTVTVTDATNGWTLATVTGVAPAGAMFAAAIVAGPVMAAGEVHYLDDVILAQPVTTGPNLLGVEAATFEGGTTGPWYIAQGGSNAVNSNGNAYHSGRCCLEMTANGTAASDFYTSIPVTPGVTYYLSWWATESSDGQAHALAFWEDAASNVNYLNGETINVSAGVWSLVRMTWTAPASAVSLFLQPRYYGPGSTTPANGVICYLDDVMVHAAAPPVPTVPGNLLAGDNANFEGGGVGDWGGQNASLANSELQSHSGGRSLLETSTSTGGGSVALSTAPLTPGAKYAYSGWGQPTTAMALGFQLGYFDAAYNYLGGDQVNGVAGSPGTWTQFKLTAVAPAGTVNTILYGRIQTAALGLQCFWDDFALVQVIPATMSMLPSGGAAGALVTITGTDLDLVQAVTVGPNPGTAIKADVQSQSATTLTFLIPHGLPASTSYAYLSYVGGVISAGALSVLTPSRPCTRTAWLTLGTLSVPLEDLTQGYVCTELDLGFPTVREVIADRPDQNGADDRTTLLGARNVTAAISALAGAGAQVDAVASSFAPFMVPSARPVLHYILDRPGAAERVMTLRASGYSWPIAGPYQRDIQLQWVCADPDAKDPNAHTVAAFAGSSVSPGRVYRRAYPLTYPVGGNSPTTGLMAPVGDLPVRPRLLIYGPVTAPVVTVSPAGAGQPATARIAFLPYFTVGAGHYVEVDCYAKTARLDGDPAQPAMTALDWQGSTWPVVNPVPPAAAGCYLQLGGSSTSSISQVQAIWNDRYLT